MFIIIVVLAFFIGFGVKGFISDAGRQDRQISAIEIGYRLCMWDVSRQISGSRLVRILETQFARRKGHRDYTADHNK